MIKCWIQNFDMLVYNFNLVKNLPDFINLLSGELALQYDFVSAHRNLPRTSFLVLKTLKPTVITEMKIILTFQIRSNH